MPVKTKKKRGFLEGYKTYNPEIEGFGNLLQWRAAWAGMNVDTANDFLGEDDPLTVMGLSEIPKTKQELDQRMRELALIHHPDRGGSVEDMKKIVAAWTVLSQKFS